MSLSALRQQLAAILPPPRAGDAAAIPTGIEALDRALSDGGVPSGRLTEIQGARGSGRTTLVRHLVTTAVEARRWTAVIDGSRTLAPREWAEAGASGRLWVIRPHGADRSAWCADILLRSGAFSLVVLDGAPPLSRQVVVRLTRLAKEHDVALVVVGDSPVIGSAVRLRVERRKPKDQRPKTTAESRVTSHESRITIRIDKGGSQVVEVSCAIEVARRLRAHPEVPDRRGVATRNRRGEKVASPHRREPGGKGREAEQQQQQGAATLPRKRRFGEAYATRDHFILEGRGETKGQRPKSRERTDDSRFTIHDSPVSAESRVTSPESRHWDGIPIALSDGLRVRAVTAAGAQVHIRAGMTVTEAESRYAGLQVLPWDQVVVDDEIRRATAAFLDASPQVTPVTGAPGMWWIGATGLDAVGGELALAQALLTLARRWHPGARVAIADSCVAARVGTWETKKAAGRRQWAVPSHESRVTSHESPAGATIIPPGSDAAYLATAPVGLIPMDEPMAEALAALGVRAAGALAALPSGDVEQRWGRTGLTAWRLARGEDRRRPGLATTEYPRTVSADLVPSVELMEPVLFLVRAALDRLLAGLVADGRAAATIAITLTLDDARGATSAAPVHTITREVRLAHPMARLIPLFESCRALLDRWTLPAPVCGVAVAIVATAPLVGEQGDLLDPSWHDPAAADAAFARLRAELGADAIVIPVVADEHRPEKSGQWLSLGDDARPEARGQGPGQRAAGSGQRAVPSHESRITSHDDDSRFTIHDSPVPACSRQLETPEPVDVECADGQPRILWWRGRRMRIERPAGPERLAGDWWKDHYVRDYWRCEDPDGEGTLVLYNDHSSGSAWFVQGWYD